MTPRWSSSSRDSTSHGSATTPSSCPWAPGIAMTEALLAVLQFADGLFPSGGFAHSFGLETYAQTGAIRDASGVGEFLRAQLEGSTGPADAVAAACAVRRAREAHLAGSVEIDQRLAAMKCETEFRAGRLEMGGLKRAEERTSELQARQY